MQAKCKNPVLPTLEMRRCGDHGGETMPIWGVYHDVNGWLTDNGVGGSYSFDVDNAMWCGPTTFDVAKMLEACDLIEPGQEQIAAACWRRVEQFLILLIK